MTTIDSSSAAESSMDDGGGGSGGGGSTDNNNNRNHQTLTKSNAAFCTDKTNRLGRKRDKNRDEEEEGDPEVWETFNKSFKQVQSVLDRNRVLIQQVNENHQSKIPDNLAKNVALIQEINGNISKVVSMYSDLSSNFSGMFHPRNEATGG